MEMSVWFGQPWKKDVKNLRHVHTTYVGLTLWHIVEHSVIYPGFESYYEHRNHPMGGVKPCSIST
jgi:hypothetical protein